MRLVRSPLAAGAAFCAAYLAAVTLGWPAVTYLPVEGDWRLGSVEGHPAMHWYGCLLTATIVALAAGWLVRDRRPGTAGWRTLASLAPWLALAVLAAREL